MALELKHVVDVLLLGKNGKEAGEMNSGKNSSSGIKHSAMLVWDQKRIRGMN